MNAGMNASSNASSQGNAPAAGPRAKRPFPCFRPQDPVANDVARASADARSALGSAVAATVAAGLTRQLSNDEARSLAVAAATRPGFRLYTGVVVGTVRRRDRFMFPLNSDYDLFSLGPDSATAVGLGHTMSLDDVIRASDGAYFGTAADY